MLRDSEMKIMIAIEEPTEILGITKRKIRPHKTKTSVIYGLLEQNTTFWI